MSDTNTDAPSSEPTPSDSSKKSDLYEIIATVLLGMATVAIAWSANQSNLWSGSQDKLLAESVRVAIATIALIGYMLTLPVA